MRDKVSQDKAGSFRGEHKREELEENNPCLKEQELSLKCLDDNNYDKDRCSIEFDNYKICRKFWDTVRSDRRRKGVVPWMPRREDRDKVKAEYIHRLHSPSK